MKNSDKKLKMVAAGLVSMSMTLLTSVSIAGNSVLGNLNGQNNVSIETATGKLAVDSAYTFFGGDKIVTGESAVAGLSLIEGGGVYVSENSKVTVDELDNGYIVEVENGAAAFSFEDSTNFSVRISNVIIQSQDTSLPVSGVASLDSNGVIVVKSVYGGFVVISDSGTTTLVNSGESFSSSLAAAKSINVQVSEGAVGVSLAAKIIAILAAVGIAVAISEDDDDATAQAAVTDATTPTATGTPVTSTTGATPQQINDARLAALRAINDARLAALRAAATPPVTPVIPTASPSTS